MSGIKPVGGLIEFAQDLQLQLIDKPFDSRIPFAEEALRLLGTCALERTEEEAEYVIDALQSFWKPNVKFTAKNTVISFGTIAMDGQFNSFSYFSIGALENHAINSLCIVLGQVKLLPDGDSLPEADLVHIPVLAVEQALRVA